MRRLIGLVGLLLVVVLLTSCSTGRDPGQRALPSPARPPATAVVHPYLVDQEGAAIAGERARLLWNGATPKPVDDPRVLATATTSESGMLSLTWRPTAAALKKARSNGGWFNFHLLVGDRESAGVFAFPSRWNGSRWIGDPASPEQPARMTTDPLEIRMSDMSVSEGR